MNKTRWWRAASLAAAAVVLSMPGLAAAAGPGAAMSLSFGTTCQGGGTVQYSWSGFHTATQVQVVVTDETTGQNALVEDGPVSAPNGTFGSFSFDLANGHDYSAVGYLGNKDNRLLKASYVVVSSPNAVACA